MTPGTTTTILHHVTPTVSPGSVPLRGAPSGVSETSVTHPPSQEPQNLAVDPVDEQRPGAEEPAESGFEVRRALWGATALVFLVAAVVLVLSRRYGYSVVTFAVALAAALNVL